MLTSYRMGKNIFQLPYNRAQVHTREIDNLSSPITPGGQNDPASIRKSIKSGKTKFLEQQPSNFAMIGLQGVKLIYGEKTILKDATFSISTNERVGLVGPNGCGVSNYKYLFAYFLHIKVIIYVKHLFRKHLK